MREILFRGKTKETGKWVEGWFCGQTCNSFFGKPVNSTQIIVKDDLGWAEVIPDTVGQYTGLCDSSGRKIFEGDIIRFPACQFPDGSEIPESCAVVVWGDGGWELEYHESSNWANEILEADTANGLEVIGNIFDNPELLEVTGNG